MIRNFDKIIGDRWFRLTSCASLATLFWFAVSNVSTNIDSRLFSELLNGAGELIPCRTIQEFGSGVTANVAATLSLFLAQLLLFCMGSIYSSYKLTGAGRYVFSIQLAALGIAVQLICGFALHTTGHPATLVFAVFSGCIIGLLLRARDDEQLLLESKQIELKMRNRELQDSRLALVKHDEADRRLLAADLHDQILSDLRLVSRNFERYVQSPDANAQNEITGLLKQTMNDVREIMDDLCPVVLEEFGLPAAVEDRLDKAAKQFGLNVRFGNTSSDSELQSLSAVEIQLLFRLVQESISNACRHACAYNLRVNMWNADDTLIINVSDDGKGADLAKLSSSSRGTLYMRLRAGLIGATVSWNPGPNDKGTSVQIRMPLPSGTPCVPTVQTTSELPSPQTVVQLV